MPSRFQPVQYPLVILRAAFVFFPSRHCMDRCGTDVLLTSDISYPKISSCPLLPCSMAGPGGLPKNSWGEKVFKRSGGKALIE